MKRSSGFSLIEITFGLLISSILSVMLFQVNGTLSRLSQSIESSLGYIRTVPLMSQQLERDISAVYVPAPIYQVIERSWKKEKSPDDAVQNDNKGVTNASLVAEAGTAEQGDAKKAADVLDKWEKIEPFFCESVDEKKLTLSFITTTTMPSFQRTVPRIVRVEYRVLPDEEGPGTFQVRRFQTFDLFAAGEGSGEQAAGDLLASGIESLKVRMIGASKDSKEAETDAAPLAGDVEAAKSSLAASQAATSWNKKDAEEQFASLLPLAIEFEGVVRSGPGGQTYPFFFSIPVASAFGSMVELDALHRKKPKQKEKKGEDSEATLPKDKNPQK